ELVSRYFRRGLPRVCHLGPLPDDHACCQPARHLAADGAGHIASSPTHAAMGALTMKLTLKTTLACALASLYAVPGHTAGLEVNVEIPRIDVAEYHRPYV